MTNFGNAMRTERARVRRRRPLAGNRLSIALLFVGMALVITKTNYDPWASAIFCVCAAVFLFRRIFSSSALSFNHLTSLSCFM